MAEPVIKCARVAGKIERVNREATAKGQNGKMKAARGCLQLRMVGESQWQILMSFTSDVDHARYEVRAVQRIRDTFVSEGKLTLELAQPQFNILIRDCSPAELGKFVQLLQTVRKEVKGQHVPTNKELMRSPAGTEKDKETPLKSCENEKLKVENPSEGPKTFKLKSPITIDGYKVGEKRPLSKTEMTKTEKASVKKAIKLSTRTLVVKERSDYPLKGFPVELERFTAQKLMLHKVDLRLQGLRYLTYLSLIDNRISSLKPLTNLRSSLEHLNLSNNLIEVIEEDIFASNCLMKLKYLNLSNNQLRTLPVSMVELTDLRELILANNKLVDIPYNFHRLCSLRILRLENNNLHALPAPLQHMRLQSLDISANCFHLCTPQRHRNLKLSTSGSTLFEQAGSVLMTHLHRNNSRVVLQSLQVPRIINDLLRCSKSCRCGAVTFHYTVSYQPSEESLADNFIKSNRGYNTYSIQCSRCALGLSSTLGLKKSSEPRAPVPKMLTVRF